MNDNRIKMNFEAMRDLTVGVWYRERWLHRLEETGFNYGVVAKQMRKQDVPLSRALTVLCGKKECGIVE